MNPKILQPLSYSMIVHISYYGKPHYGNEWHDEQSIHPFIRIPNSPNLSQTNILTSTVSPFRFLKTAATIEEEPWNLKKAAAELRAWVDTRLVFILTFPRVSRVFQKNGLHLIYISYFVAWNHQSELLEQIHSHSDLQVMYFLLRNKMRSRPGQRHPCPSGPTALTHGRLVWLLAHLGRQAQTILL